MLFLERLITYDLFSILCMNKTRFFILMTLVCLWLNLIASYAQSLSFCTNCQISRSLVQQERTGDGWRQVKKAELDSGIGNISQRRGTLQIRKAVSEKNTEVYDEAVWLKELFPWERQKHHWGTAKTTWKRRDGSESQM